MNKKEKKNAFLLNAFHVKALLEAYENQDSII